VYVLRCGVGVEHVVDVGHVAGIGHVGRKVGIGRVAGVVGIWRAVGIWCTVGECRHGWVSALCSQRMAGICVVQALGGCGCG
jgi:hypothetical protein